MIYRFGSIDVDTDRFTIMDGGKTVLVEPLVFDLLVYFVKHPDKVISRDDLLDDVWAGRLVSDSTIAGVVRSARKAIGDDGKSQKYIKTIHGRGFRFAATVNTVSEPSDQVEPATKTFTDPSLLILPFRSFGDHAEGISQQLAARLETVLTRVPLLNISTEGARFAHLEITPTPRQIHEELGIDYVLESTLHVGPSATLTTQLSEARTGFRIWSETFTSEVDDGEDVTETLINNVAAKLEPQLNNAVYKNIREIEGYHGSRQLYLQASGLLALKGWHQNTFREAADLLNRCMQLDPMFVYAPAYLSLILAFGHRVGLLSEWAALKPEAMTAAERALQFNDLDSTIYGFTGCAFCDLGEMERGVPLLKKAIRLNSANGQAWVALGAANIMQRDVESAIKNLEHGIHLSPMDNRLSVWRSLLAVAYLLKQDLERAEQHALAACEFDDQNYMPRLALAAVRLQKGEPALSKSALSEAYRIKSDLSNAEIQGLLGARLRKKLTTLL